MFDGAPDAGLVETGAPRVTIRNAFLHPFDSAIAAARTCYSSHLITPDEITDKQRLNIGAATFYSGHHTVYQHAHFEFGLENVSRQFVWSFLHAHPFYNSEQQSQRYVRLDRAQAYIPPVSLFSMKLRAKSTKTRLPAPGPTTANSPPSLSPMRATSSATSGTSARCRIPSASRKSNAPPRNAPSKLPATCCLSPPSPPWCTPFPASFSIACGACAPPRTPPAKPAPSSVTWSRRCANWIRSFSIGSAPPLSKKLPEWKDAAPLKPEADEFAAEFDAQPRRQNVTTRRLFSQCSSRHGRIVPRRRRPHRNPPAPMPKPSIACSIPPGISIASKP